MRRFQSEKVCVIAAAAGYAIFALCSSAAAAEGPSIFPTPRDIKSGSDFVLDEQAVIAVPAYPSEQDLFLARSLADDLGDRFTVHLKTERLARLGPGPPHDRDRIDRQSPGADVLRKSRPVREPTRSGSGRLHSPDQREHCSGGRRRSPRRLLRLAVAAATSHSASRVSSASKECACGIGRPNRFAASNFIFQGATTSRSLSASSGTSWLCTNTTRSSWK